MVRWWLFGITFFLVLIGSIWGSVTSTKLNKMSRHSRWMTQIGGFVIMSCLLGGLMSQFNFNPWYLAMLAIFLGLISARMGMTATSLWTDDDDFSSFAGKLGRFVATAKRIVDSIPEPAPTDKTAGGPSKDQTPPDLES